MARVMTNVMNYAIGGEVMVTLLLLRTVFAATLCAVATYAVAQSTYPDKAVRIIADQGGDREQGQGDQADRGEAGLRAFALARNRDTCDRLQALRHRL